MPLKGIFFEDVPLVQFMCCCFLLLVLCLPLSYSCCFRLDDHSCVGDDEGIMMVMDTGQLQ